ncbi:MAG: DUF4445 domain-containing protein [Proteobacteria bacterium]|nr:DUF4445 domain-containing protein [Pseudomonadota bacterium]
MTTMTIETLYRRIRLKPGETVRDALIRSRVAMDYPCDGNGLCGRCLIRVRNPENVAATPHENLTSAQEKEGYRLACCLVPESDLSIITIPSLVPEGEKQRILGADGFSGPGTRRRRKPQAPRNGGRVRPAVRVRQKDGSWVLTDFETPGQVLLHAWKKGFSPRGLAVDLGTTTLVVSLVCLETGQEIATASCLNPQVAFGHDVMTRIQKGSDPGGLEDLCKSVRVGISRLVAEVCEDAGASPLEVVDAVVGGNATMLQLAAGVDPASLGRWPFTVGISSGVSYLAASFGLRVNPAARVWVPPVAHAFVGSDISAGLLACPNFFQKKSRVLFVDVGTNGELGLAVDGAFTVTSTAAGPAFEGMGLTCGMRAKVGAVEAVSAGPGGLEITTVGGAPVRGLCGSGVIDLMAALLRLGVVEPSGRMARPGQGGPLAQSLVELDGKPAVRLGRDVFFTQEDVRQVQLAKSAIRTALDMLLAEAGHPVLDAVILAGGFGHSLNAASLEEIGMIPPGMGARLSFAGNTSLEGCHRLLTDASLRPFLRESMEQARHLHLVEDPDYMDQYVMNMEFPETGNLEFPEPPEGHENGHCVRQSAA